MGTFTYKESGCLYNAVHRPFINGGNMDIYQAMTMTAFGVVFILWIASEVTQ